MKMMNALKEYYVATHGHCSAYLTLALARDLVNDFELLVLDPVE